MAARILLKTTIGAHDNDWNVGRFSLLAQHLRSLRDLSGSPLYEVVARNRAENAAGDDVDLAELAGGAYDQLWLIGADVTGALTAGALAPNLETEHVGGAGLGTRLALGIVITSAGDRASWFACTLPTRGASLVSTPPMRSRKREGAYHPGLLRVRQASRIISRRTPAG